jgi:hypothetical protein
MIRVRRRKEEEDEGWLVLPEELLHVVTATARPGNIAQVLTFDPFSRHDVEAVRT